MPSCSVKIENLRNLGPKSAARLREIGIETRDDLEKRGVILAFLEVEAIYPRWSNLAFLWAMWGALHDCDWRELSEETKTKLRAALELESP